MAAIRLWFANGRASGAAMLQIANAPCSWGVLEFNLEGQAAGYAQVLDEMRASGYVGTELGDWGFMPTEPALLKNEIDARGLQMLAAFVPVDLSNADAHAHGEANAIRAARLLAAVNPRALIVLADDNGKNPNRTKRAGQIRVQDGLNDAQWDIFARGVERIARAVKNETGLRLVFHHHCAGFVETPNEIDMLLARTDANLVGLCFDTGHYAFGGGDSLDGLKKHIARVWHVHFKDHAPRVHEQAIAHEWDYFQAVRHGIFCELGQGDVDFRGVAEFLQARGYDGWIVVEQDVLPGSGTPFASAQRNRAYLKTIGL